MIHCECAMFLAKGTCWHTGYSGTTYKPPPFVPQAMQRSREWLNELEKKGLKYGPDGRGEFG